jgi:hypothetical protein
MPSADRDGRFQASELQDQINDLVHAIDMLPIDSADRAVLAVKLLQLKQEQNAPIRAAKERERQVQERERQARERKLLVESQWPGVPGATQMYDASSGDSDTRWNPAEPDVDDVEPVQGTDGKWRLFDIHGTQIGTPLPVNSVYRRRNNMLRVMRNDHYGFLDEKGNAAIDFKYDRAYAFSEDVAAVRVGKLWGYVTKAGSFLLEPYYTSAQSFSEGLAPVSIGKGYG